MRNLIWLVLGGGALLLLLGRGRGAGTSWAEILALPEYDYSEPMASVRVLEPAERAALVKQGIVPTGAHVKQYISVPNLFPIMQRSEPTPGAQTVDIFVSESIVPHWSHGLAALRL